MNSKEEVWISVSAAARLLETTEMRILMMLRQGELHGRQEEEGWLVESSSLTSGTLNQAAGKVRHVGCGGGCGGCGHG